MITSSDVYILAGIVALDTQAWTLRELAARLLVDHTLVHRALKRTSEVDLYLPASQQVHVPNLEEFLVHAGRFVIPGKLGATVSGVLAAWAAQPMSGKIRSSQKEGLPVWPSAQGRVRGQALEPLHPSAVHAVHGFPQLSAVLSVIDSLRAGDLRVRRVAARELHQIFQQSIKAPGGVV